jgi:hypothetical protein
VFEGVEWIKLAQDRVHGNETLGSVKGWEFLDKLSVCKIIEKDSSSM